MHIGVHMQRPKVVSAACLIYREGSLSSGLDGLLTLGIPWLPPPNAGITGDLLAFPGFWESKVTAVCFAANFTQLSHLTSPNLELWRFHPKWCPRYAPLILVLCSTGDQSQASGMLGPPLTDPHPQPYTDSVYGSVPLSKVC